MLSRLSRAYPNIFSVVLYLSYDSFLHYYNNVNRWFRGGKNLNLEAFLFPGGLQECYTSQEIGG